MPEKWIRKLNQAALTMDEDLILNLIQEIPEANQNLAKNLTTLVNNYRFDLLCNLTK